MLNLFLLSRLFGPKRKMTSAIARWHSSARPPGDALEQAYADQLEAEMQEMAIQLHKVTKEEALTVMKVWLFLTKKKRFYLQSSNSFPTQRCEEVASLQSQVSQEKELRTVMEGFLMEDKMAWRRVHEELVETHRLAQEMSATAAQSRACRAELLSCLSTTENSSSYTDTEDKTEGDTGVKGERRCPLVDISFYILGLIRIVLFLIAAVEVLKRSSVGELLKKLDSHEEELGKMVKRTVIKVFLCHQWSLTLSGCFIATAANLQTVLQSLRRLSAPEKVSDSWERP